MEQRQIKFRIWNKEYKQMHYPDRYVLDSYWFGVSMEHYIDDSTGYYPINSKELVLMQFVGLLDENEKEIYEGDIIEFHADYTSHERCGYHKGVVKWTPETMRFDIYVPGHEEPFDCNKETDEWYYKREVIGNIYETPELLTSNN